MNDNEFDDEVNNLIEWCEDLDYDKYMENWHTLATSSKPEVPSDDNAVHVYQAGLGDITIGLNQQSLNTASQHTGANYLSTREPGPNTGSPAAGAPGESAFIGGSTNQSSGIGNPVKS